MEGTVDQLVYPFAHMPAARDVIEVADGILWLSSPLPFVGLKQVNLWLLHDGDGWTMVDCGYGNDLAWEDLNATWAAALDGRPIRRLIITHFHPDHTGNARRIAERWGVTPLMSQAEWFAANLASHDRASEQITSRVAFFRAHGLSETRVKVFAEGVVPYAAGVALPPTHQSIRDGDTIAIGGDSWTVITGEGHSPEHAALYCAARKILISGDQILPTITTNISVWPDEPEGDPLGLFLKTCTRLRGLIDPGTLVLPSHRRPFRNVQRRLDELAHHHDERLALIVASAAQEITAADLIDVLFPRALDGHQMGFAMGEAIAHLNYLVRQGRMERRRDPSGTWRFKAA